MRNQFQHCSTSHAISIISVVIFKFQL